MRFLYATALSLALWSVAGAQAPIGNRPQVPETFVKELSDGLRELTAAVKAIPTTVHIETSWNLGNNAVLGIGIASGAALLCTFTVCASVLIGIPRRQ